MQNKTKQSGSRWDCAGIQQLETQEYSNIEKQN